jgi:NAD(P)-dependent dehydrogenase (short-subunit alcohol dehydrogenase family)
MKLKGRVAIVTGAGRGIGKAIALAFAREGANLTVVSRTLAEVEQTAREAEVFDVRVLPLRVDVSRAEEVDSMVEETLRRFGKIDVLVNNAGILGPIGLLVENDVKLWIETVHVNLIGTFLCCRAVLPHMMKRRSGKIINLSGGGAAYPKPRFSAYACSKAAVVRLTETLAEEVKDYNIQVNAIAPGMVKTRMVEQIVESGDKAGENALTDARRVLEDGGAGFEPVTSLAVFLASDESDGLTGRLISAVWDDWRSLDKDRIMLVMERGYYTLRRIDGHFFIPKDGDIPRR